MIRVLSILVFGLMTINTAAQASAPACTAAQFKNALAGNELFVHGGIFFGSSLFPIVDLCTDGKNIRHKSGKTTFTRCEEDGQCYEASLVMPITAEREVCVPVGDDCDWQKKVATIPTTYDLSVTDQQGDIEYCTQRYTIPACGF